MNNLATYLQLLEGKWDCERLIFDFLPITKLPDTEYIEITLIDNLLDTKSSWQGYLKEEKGKMFLYHSSPDFTDRRAEIMKLNNTVMVWEIKEEFNQVTKLTFERL